MFGKIILPAVVSVGERREMTNFDYIYSSNLLVNISISRRSFPRDVSELRQQVPLFRGTQISEVVGNASVEYYVRLFRPT